MEVTVNLLNKKIQVCRFDDFEVLSDANLKHGGEARHPEPFDYFVASVAMCGAHYARAFCEARSIECSGLRLITKTEKNPETGKTVFKSKLHLPKDFPEKYKKSILATVSNCTVKKVIMAGPEFEYELID